MAKKKTIYIRKTDFTNAKVKREYRRVFFYASQSGKIIARYGMDSY